MPKFNERFKYLRSQKKLSQQELADLLGISKSSVNMYERGEREPSLETLELIADFFNVDMDYLLGKSDCPNRYAYSQNNSSMELTNIFPISVKRFPMLGKIACGEPIYVDEEHESYILANSNIKADFCLIAKGDSMINARINDGDVVFIHSQPTVENGEIAAVIIGDEATLKRVYLKANVVTLVAENPKYEPMVYAGDELENIRILGKAVCFMSNL